MNNLSDLIRRIKICLITFILFLGTTSPLLAQVSCHRPSGWHVSEQTFKCPLGGKEFTAFAFGTHSVMGRRLDWKPISSAQFPRPLPVCPDNGFIMYKTTFTQEEIQADNEIFKTPAYQSLLKENSPYFLFSYLLKQRKQKADHWYLILQASWETEGCAPELNKKYLEMAIEKLLSSLKKDKSFSENWWSKQLLIANLYRRTGKFDLALSYLDRLPNDKLPAGEYLGKLKEKISQFAQKSDMSPQSSRD
ncbi:MAG: hypothetical protein KAI89_01880 [Emcibacter sp.]|nr:hypothetical protein [Emcibacter sp.]